MAFEAAPVLTGHPLERRITDINTVIAFFSEEWRWTQGSFRNIHSICPEEALRKFHVQHLEDHILYAAQQVTGYAYNSIPAFNDARTTTHETLMAALVQARWNIAAMVNPVCPAPNTAPPPPEGMLPRTKAALNKAAWFGVIGDVFRLIGYALTERAEGPFAKNY